jgi:hypothetical protein
MGDTEALEWTARPVAVYSCDVERAADALGAKPENLRRIIVVAWSPRSSCTVRMSWPRSSRCVADECRNVWQETRFASPDRMIASCPLNRRLMQMMAPPTFS